MPDDLPAEPTPDGGTDGIRSDSLEPRSDAGLSLPFHDLEAPAPIEPAPSTPIRWLAFAGVLLGGLLGALVGYGIGDVLYPDSLGAEVGALLGGMTGAIGVGVLANLTLRAMNEWNTAGHPEADTLASTDRKWTRRPSA
ncbi:MAG: hypothetical protein OER95_10325 [Acidimicrobiia bacterium]|nr:hypothetical protein [Acidimicrobiia bacterium]